MHPYVRYFSLLELASILDVAVRASVFLSHLFLSSSDHPTPKVNPGDFIYFPDRYWHATINLDPYTVFVSTFTTEHQEGPLGDEL
jgi:uncharacterized RmlC-like cupin family protein